MPSGGPFTQRPARTCSRRPSFSEFMNGCGFVYFLVYFYVDTCYLIFYMTCI